MRLGAALLILALGIGTARAEDGKVLYETYCGACHGPDGMGVGGGQFPPLAGSEWVHGDPGRMVQIVLHGLQGEITVTDAKGDERGYNLVMPPQGAALRDAQIAAIATHVRASWGNEGGAVTPAMVAEEREATARRKTMWTASEILKRHPIEPRGPGQHGIKDLVSYVFEGKFKSLEKLREAKPVAVEEEQGGVISLKHAGERKDHFGLVWEGKITAPKAGRYSFHLDSDDGAAVFVNDQAVVEIGKIGGMGRSKAGKISLEAGDHPIRIEYYEFEGKEGISLAWRGPGVPRTHLSEDQGRGRKKRRLPSIPLQASDGRARLYRNFIEGSTARGIGVGFPGKVNLVFSADHLALELLWQGDFMDAGRHWTNRGQGWTAPGGEGLKLTGGPAFAVGSRPGPWPKSWADGSDARFRGYQLNKQKEPTFFYNIGPLEVTDICRGETRGSLPGLARRIEIEAPEDSSPRVDFLVASGHRIEPVCTRGFRLGEGLLVQVAGQASGKPEVRGDKLVVPLRLHPGKNVFEINYTFD